MTARTAHLVAEQGMSGDMWLGALVDAGAPLPCLQAAVDVLDLGARARLETSPVSTNGIAATHVDVDIPSRARRIPTLAIAREVVGNAPLHDAVKGRALAVYEALAAAEAEVHGTSVDEVHLHEIGDPDTAVDIVAACAGVVALGLDQLTCGPVVLGGGTIQAAHGELAVPAPAVTSLLRGFIVRGGPGGRELTTPTGAALASALAEPCSGLPVFRLEGQGRGASDEGSGGRSVLTVLVGARMTGVGDGGRETLSMVETTVDDLQPEFVPDVLDRARANPAVRDAWATPTLMKKGRPGYTLSVLVADPGSVEEIRHLLFQEAGTLGVRWYEVVRESLARRWIDVEISGCPVRVKLAGPEGDPIRVAPEHDDVAAAAATLDRPVREIHDAALAAARAAIASRGGTRASRLTAVDERVP